MRCVHPLGLVQATRSSTVLVQVARTSRAMTNKIISGSASPGSCPSRGRLLAGHRGVAYHAGRVGEPNGVPRSQPLPRGNGPAGGNMFELKRRLALLSFALLGCLTFAPAA